MKTTKPTHQNLLTFLLVGAMSMFMLTFNSCQTCNKECCAKIEGEGEEPATAARQLGENEFVKCDTVSFEGFEQESITLTIETMDNAPITEPTPTEHLTWAQAETLRTNFLTYMASKAGSFGASDKNFSDFVFDSDPTYVENYADYQRVTHPEPGQAGYRVVYGLINPSAGSTDDYRFAKMIYPIDADGDDITPPPAQIYTLRLPKKLNSKVIHCPPYCD